MARECTRNRPPPDRQVSMNASDMYVDTLPLAPYNAALGATGPFHTTTQPVSHPPHSLWSPLVSNLNWQSAGLQTACRRTQRHPGNPILLAAVEQPPFSTTLTAAPTQLLLQLHPAAQAHTCSLLSSPRLSQPY